MLPDLNSSNIAIIGLGYVGLPLAIEFARAHTGRAQKIIGYDISQDRINQLLQGYDSTHELDSADFKLLENIELTYNQEALVYADVYIVTVPTPIDDAKRPDLTPLIGASQRVGDALKARARHKNTCPVIVYESTVYPGATEEICVPVLEKHSGLEYNVDFFCGYSPERINPGDKSHKLRDIVKLVSGSTKEALTWIDSLYSTIISAGTHRTSSIKVAEAAKVIENTQRDINIAFVNELAIILSKLHIDTNEVLDAAGTKWNFLDFRPGLVGGHCIGVDPYYLTHKSEQVGYHPQVVLSGRRINDEMPNWIVEQIILELCKRNKCVAGSKILIMGVTFKENCPDTRNSLAKKVLLGLYSYGVNLAIFDPWIENAFFDLGKNCQVPCVSTSDGPHDAVVITVAHKSFLEKTPSEWMNSISEGGFFYDVKGILPKELDAIRL